MVASISVDELHSVSYKLLRRREESLRAAGNNFEHFLWHLASFLLILLSIS